MPKKLPQKLIMGIEHIRLFFLMKTFLIKTILKCKISILFLIIHIKIIFFDFFYIFKKKYLIYNSFIIIKKYCNYLSF